MKKPVAPLLLLALSAASAHAAGYDWKYRQCMDYYSFGPTQCPAEDQGVTPVQAAQNGLAQPISQPQVKKDRVQEFLDNYGKPPREFVEYYFEPTPENAMKWVATYNQIAQRSQDLGRTWAQAEQVYNDMIARGVDPSRIVSSNLPPVPDMGSQGDGTRRGVSSRVAPVPPQPVSRKDTVSSFDITSSGTSGISFGAFENSPTLPSVAETGAAQLTYYFSASCPYCAKMTPELNNIVNALEGKLAITCVDLTPTSATVRPLPQNIENKLICQWRLPENGEIEKYAIRQTPTVRISKKGQEPVQLSGYQSPEKLLGALDLPAEPAKPEKPLGSLTFD